MTRTSSLLQWLALAVVAAALIGCPADKQDSSQDADTPSPLTTEADPPPAPEAAPSEPTVDGGAVYATAGCITCHGDNLAGKPRLGPPIKGMAQHWTADELEAYLANPQEYKAGNERLTTMAKEYGMVMPIAPITESERKALAAWLLRR